MKNLFKVNIFTYLFLILSFLSGYFREICIVYIILIVHELGHYFIMKLYNIDVKDIILYPYGGMIHSNMLINTNSKKVLLISLGGIISQLFFFIIVYFFYKLDLVNVYYYDIFFKYNNYLIIFNLLPLYPLDGFKIINSLLEMFVSYKTSIVISLLINFVFLLLFILYLYMFRVSNYVIVLFLVLNLFKYIKEVRYVINKFYVERIIYNIRYDGICSVSNLNKLYKNNYNYINGIGEKEYLVNKYGIFF